MPSPVGHALGGLIVALAVAPAEPRRQPLPHATTATNFVRGLREDRMLRLYAAFCVAAACVPDVDFAWGRHNMETHSIGFALLCGLVVLAWRHSSRLAIACALAASTHVVFDWLGSDDSPPLGVMALWPFSSEFYFANAFVFEAISRRYWLPGFVMHNTLAVLREVAILLPVLALIARRRTAARLTVP